MEERKTDDITSVDGTNLLIWTAGASNAREAFEQILKGFGSDPVGPRVFKLPAKRYVWLKDNLQTVTLAMISTIAIVEKGAATRR